jgi:tetratricopeptide (TPR) repeat protein
VTCGGVTLVAAALAGDSNLGYARNWDLMAAYACVLTVCGLGLLLARGPTPLPRWAVPALAALSLYHTAPWIALNASESRALARFATLPLGMGRVESTLGYWYAVRGEPLEAERHYARSLEQNPANLRAHLGLAAIYRRRGDAVGEVLALREAVSLRPADERARSLLLDALVRGHAWDAAAIEAAELAALRPRDPSLAVARAIVLALATRDSAATHALDEADAWARGDPSARRRPPRPRSTARPTALERLWATEFATPETPVP